MENVNAKYGAGGRVFRDERTWHAALRMEA